MEAKSSKTPNTSGWKARYISEFGVEVLDLDLWEEADEGIFVVHEEVKDVAEGESDEIWKEERHKHLAKMHLYGLLRIAKAIEGLKSKAEGGANG